MLFFEHHLFVVEKRSEVLGHLLHDKEHGFIGLRLPCDDHLVQLRGETIGFAHLGKMTENSHFSISKLG
jgi:hypothetical protein